MNANANFWNHFTYSSLLTAIIILGRVFSKEKSCGNNSHCLSRLISIIETTDEFKSKNLRKRKTEGSENFEDWIDSYMEGTHVLNESDFKDIRNLEKQTRDQWNKISYLRNKIFAHRDVLKGNNLQTSENTTYQEIEKIIENLLILKNIFWQAYHNGRKPDFLYSNLEIEKDIKKDVASLFSRIV